METYLKTLELLKSLLISNGEQFWADWMQKDIDVWNKDKSTEHHLHAFGGAGSFNDINLGQNDKIGYWKNALLSNLASISYGFAKTQTIEIPKGYFSQLEGGMCRKCKNGDIAENSIERFLAAKFIPEIIEKNLLSNDFLEILNLENFQNNSETQTEKAEIINAIKNANIKLNPFGSAWEYDCKICGEPNKISYRWDVIFKNDFFKIIKSDDNFEI
ncbi:hypothetical protein EGI22_08870 [Lacihabitans sp. LS3-19]|uniref:DUF6966 domain-containing protein n=1 Tax=Lacihabitans sp. LS3-19 TaxID=2487335 RepID=UPI0020CF2BE3|nr:hypothetical protein [Lacihabitans sp. LS3-19]MCP9768024.1 hypothetical protein [Lacihabitans sp. LS3-19]